MIYLLHFERPYHHARHYLGCTGDLVRRLREHLGGKGMGGSPLVEAVRAAGIGVTLVRLWPDSFDQERRLKRWHGGSQFCPLCNKRAMRHAPNTEFQVINQQIKSLTCADLPEVIRYLRKHQIKEN